MSTSDEIFQGARVLVCGGRDFNDRALFDRVMAPYRVQASVIITGCASGADAMARSWAQTWGVPLDWYKANWRQHGRAAGPLRNRVMLDAGKPDLVIAFPGGNGTEDMCRKAEAAGVPVMRVTEMEGAS